MISDDCLLDQEAKEERGTVSVYGVRELAGCGRGVSSVGTAVENASENVVVGSMDCPRQQPMKRIKGRPAGGGRARHVTPIRPQLALVWPHTRPLPQA
jgi:hypothetical protein